MDDELTSRIVRSADLRPSWRQVAWRSLLVTLNPPANPIFTSPAMHRVLKAWLVELGHPGAAGT